MNMMGRWTAKSSGTLDVKRGLHVVLFQVSNLLNMFIMLP